MFMVVYLGGVDVRFTQEPSNPSYFNNGSDANLVWDYTDPHNEIQYITYSVLVDGTFVRMIFNDSGGVQEHPKIPPSYKGRVKIEGRATLVIKNINPGDNTEFECELIGDFLYVVQSTVQLIVAGMYDKRKSSIVKHKWNAFNSCLSYFWGLEKVINSINMRKPLYAGLKVAS